MRLLIGMDQVAIFESWKGWERVVELAEPVVMRRPGETGGAALAPGKKLAGQGGWRERVVEVPEWAVSSSEVRRRVGRGESIAGLVSDRVAQYIREHRLYRMDGEN